MGVGGGRKFHVLAVDDSFTDRKLIERILKTSSFHDYSMPGMTGFDLLRKIKESEGLKGIPVVVMSSENVPARINRCLEEGAHEFLLKPVRLSDVDHKMKPHLFVGL